MERKMKKYQGYLVLLSLFAVIGLWTVMLVAVNTIVQFINMTFKISLLEVSGILSLLGLIILISGMTIESYLVSRMMRAYSKEFKESCNNCKYRKCNSDNSSCKIESNLQKQVSRLKREREEDN